VGFERDCECDACGAGADDDDRRGDTHLVAHPHGIANKILFSSGARYFSTKLIVALRYHGMQYFGDRIAIDGLIA
jgi:hypothetical protein